MLYVDVARPDRLSSLDKRLGIFIGPTVGAGAVAVGQASVDPLEMAMYPVSCSFDLIGYFLMAYSLSRFYSLKGRLMLLKCLYQWSLDHVVALADLSHLSEMFLERVRFPPPLGMWRW